MKDLIKVRTMVKIISILTLLWCINNYRPTERKSNPMVPTVSICWTADYFIIASMGINPNFKLENLVYSWKIVEIWMHVIDNENLSLTEKIVKWCFLNSRSSSFIDSLHQRMEGYDVFTASFSEQWAWSTPHMVVL